MSKNRRPLGLCADRQAGNLDGYMLRQLRVQENTSLDLLLNILTTKGRAPDCRRGVG